MSNCLSPQNGSIAIGLSEVTEPGLGAEIPNGNGKTPRQRRIPPRPQWGLLYAMLPLTLLLFILADLVPETSGWRTVTESIAALVIFGVQAAWVRANRTALVLSQDEADTTSRP